MLQLRTSALACAALLAMAAQTFAQQQQAPAYNRVVCLKAMPGKMAELQKFAMDPGHKMRQAEADAGEFQAALVGRTVYPAGENAACDFVMVALYNGFPPEPGSGMSLKDTLDKAGVQMTAEAYSDEARGLAKLVSVDLWRTVDGFGNPQKDDYIQVNLMKPHAGQQDEWMKMEREVMKPVHQARAEQGIMRAWKIEVLAYPSGTSLPFSAATVDVAPSWKALGGPSGYAEAFKKAKPEMDAEQTFQKIVGMRDIVRTELYHVIDLVTPQNTATRMKR